jgi:Kef-type K+ transport system membrane component KefB
MQQLVGDIALCVVSAWVSGLAAYLLRQPSILAYLIAGFLIGPFGAGWISSRESVATISELGLIFMLFMIGLEVDMKKIVRAGSAILLAGGIQLLGSVALGIVFFTAIGPALTGFDALYLCVACALSSTVIIVRVLYEKRELDTLAGRITLGIMVLQDIFAIMFLAIQPSLGNLEIGVVLLSCGRVILLITAALLVSRFVLPPIFHRVARTPELLLLGAIAWCFFVAETAEKLHLSREMGALVAGVSLSTFPYALDVTAKLTTLRDFFITLFFVAFGMTIPVPSVSVMTLALIIAGFTVASRVLTTFTPLYLMHQGLRTSLLPAINLAQISEFSLVIIQAGITAGHLRADIAGAASFAFAVLAVLSTFAIFRSEDIVRFSVQTLVRVGVPDLGHPRSEGDRTDDVKARRSMILGFFRSASALLSEIRRRAPLLIDQIGVVDFNPQVFRSLVDRGVQVTYGDITNLDLLVHAGVGKAELVILSVPDSLLKGGTNEKLVRQIRSINKTAKIVATAELLASVHDLYAAGADYVTVPRIEEAQELYRVIEAADAGLLADKRGGMEGLLANRDDILP